MDISHVLGGFFTVSQVQAGMPNILAEVESMILSDDKGTLPDLDTALGISHLIADISDEEDLAARLPEILKQVEKLVLDKARELFPLDNETCICGGELQHYVKDGKKFGDCVDCSDVFVLGYTKGTAISETLPG